jgi:hypothetical protein
MKKVKNIFITVLFSTILFFFIFGALGDHDMNIWFLQGIGNLFLFIVSFLTSVLLFGSLIFIPWIVYLKLKKDKESLKDFNELIIPFAIVIGAIALLSIAGVQLRGLKEFDYKPTEVRIVGQSRTTSNPSENPKYLGGECFYYNDSISEWALTSPQDYIKKKGKSSHLLYRGKSETKYYRKNSLGNWIEVNKMEFNAFKSKGVQTITHTPIPEIKYFLFSSNNWQKITKEEFFKYIELDSIVRYE